MQRSLTAPSGIEHRVSEPIRLQKFLANAGVASRRAAEELITNGRVSVNGRQVTELGTKVHPARDHVAVDGTEIKRAVPTWVVLNKPRGFLTSRGDPRRRRTVYDLLPSSLHSLFYVGRLDYDTEGLLLLTNDGDGAQRLQHPRHEVTRVYEAIVQGVMRDDTPRRLMRGVRLDDGPARAKLVRVTSRGETETRLRLTMTEGRNREVRRMLEAVGHTVVRLRRVEFGPIKLGRIKPGEWRYLTDDEIGALK